MVPRGASQVTRPERANKNTKKKLDGFRMRFRAVRNLAGWAVPKVGLSRKRNDTFQQKIVFRVDGKLCFISGAPGMDPVLDPAMLQARHNLRPQDRPSHQPGHRHRPQARPTTGPATATGLATATGPAHSRCPSHRPGPPACRPQAQSHAAAGPAPGPRDGPQPQPQTQTPIGYAVLGRLGWDDYEDTVEARAKEVLANAGVGRELFFGLTAR